MFIELHGELPGDHITLFMGEFTGVEQPIEQRTDLHGLLARLITLQFHRQSTGYG